MGKNSDYVNLLNELRGKTIGIIYFFENEDALGSDHYWIWKSDIISGWLLAVQELECVPYIMDVRTFIQKGSVKKFVSLVKSGSFLVRIKI